MSSIKYDFSGENFVVTGASSGMGRQIALDLAKAGAKVLAIARREEELKRLQEEYPNNIYILAVDVCNYVALEEGIVSFVKSFGKLKGAVHAAGIENFTPLRSFDSEVAQKIVEVSFWAGIHFSQIVNKKKNSTAGCSTVLFSSIAAQTGKKGSFAYSAAKAALNVAVRSLAKEICTDMKRINTVMPGWVKTDMTLKVEENVSMQSAMYNQHLLGVGMPEDVSEVVLFLLSDASSWITGTNLVVDGGYLAGAD